jgi:hypothetical protein
LDVQINDFGFAALLDLRTDNQPGSFVVSGSPIGTGIHARSPAKIGMIINISIAPHNDRVFLVISLTS